MEIFAENPGFVYLEDIECFTIVNDIESGKDKTRNKWPTGTINGVTRGTAKRTFSLQYNGITQSRYDSIVTFFLARVGRKEAFFWENFNESPIIQAGGQYPTGIIVDASFAGADTSQLAHYPIVPNSQVLYDDGVALVEGVNYSIVDATGVITWIIKPADLSVICANYRFYRTVRFTEDKLSPVRTAYQRYDLQFSVKEIEPRL